MSEATPKQFVAVLDFGAQYGQLIARRVRDLHVYSEIVPCDIPADELAAMRPSALILSGGPASVYAEDAPSVDPAIFSLGLPVLVQMGGMSVITFVVNRLLGDVAGTQGVNTFAYVVRLASFGIMPFTAAAQAASPMIGFYLGAGARQRVKKTAVTACTVCALWAVLALLAVQVFPSVLMRVFTNSTDLVALGAQALRTVSPAILFVFLPLLFGAFFQSAGKMAGALFLNALPVACVPFFAWFLSARFGTSGVWWAFVLGCACACFFGALYAGFAVRKHSAAA